MARSVAVALRSHSRSVNPFESLERRVLLAAAASAIARPVIHELVDLSEVPRTREVIKLERAGAKLFDGVAQTGAARNGSTTLTDIVNRASAFTLNLTGVRQTLANAPMEFTAAASNPLTLALPTPNGTYSRFAIVEAPIMEPGLAAKFPDIKTYRGQGIDDPTATVRLDHTMHGFHAQVLSPNGAYYINPQYHLDAKGTYLSYFKRDAVRPASHANYDLHAEDGLDLEDDHHVNVDLVDEGKTTLNSGTLGAAPFGSQLRTFRAAVAANGEYTVFHGGTVASGQAAVVTSMNRVVGVYETELAVRMVLVANNSNVIYTNSATDPYSNSSSAINQNTANLNAVIGSANYDIGHVYTTGSGGVAFLGCVGGPSKGGGTTGLPSPTGDVFYIDYVAHEMGHQFGANHTFNQSHGQRNSSTAFEPGSGSSIMGYAGLFGGDDVQSFSDPYMHSASIDEIRNFITFSIPGVGTTTATGNNPPTVAALTTYTIPTGTPFALTGSATDPDGDALTYEWQERELGPAGGLLIVDNGTSPFNRAIIPTVSPTRMLPRLSGILNGTNQVNNPSSRPVERLYTVARSPASWRLIVRDNKSGGGGVASQDVNITVVNPGLGGFLITNNNSAATLPGGSTLNLTWNVAGTTGNGIDVANVKISLSTNAGQSFNTVLAASTANDGSENVVLPNINASNVRIKVEAVGNIFFDINNGSMTIQQQAVANGTWTGLGDGSSWNQNTNWSNNTIPGPGDDVTINVLAGNPTINVGGAQSVRSVNSSEALNITGSLDVSQASTFNGAVALAGGTFSGAGNATFAGGLTWNGGTLSGAGSTIIPNGAAFNVTATGVSSTDRALVLNGTGSLASGGNKVLVVSSMSIGGLLDLNDNDLVLDYTGVSQASSVQSHINSGRNGGDWLGTTGITSTEARNANPRITTLGAIEASDFKNIYGPAATFSGATIDPTAVLVKYTYYGDADFNGAVNFDDYGRIDNGFGNSLTGWLNGDLDGNGLVNFDDYSLIDQAFSTQGATL